MADKKISQLPLGNIIPETIFPIVTSGITSQTTFSNVVDTLYPYFSSGTQNFESVLNNGNTTTNSFYNLFDIGEGSFIKTGVIPTDGPYPCVGSSINFGGQQTDFLVAANPITNNGAFLIISQGGLNQKLEFNLPNKPNNDYPNPNIYTLATLDDITGNIPVSITKTELDNLISTNSLVSGTLYEITGVHPTLYNDGTNSGTTIYLQAITTNKLTTQGYGIFYNPLYNKSVSGFGIWNNTGTWEAVLNTEPVSNRFATTGGYPQAIVLDSTNNLFVTNINSDNVTKITPDGVSSTFGSLSIDSPIDIVIDSDDNLYVLSSVAGDIIKITPDGVSSVFATTMSSPASISIDSIGNLYVPGRFTNNVIKVTPLGVTSVFATISGEASGSIFDVDDNLYVVIRSLNNVTKITPSGVSSVFATTGSDPYSIVVDQNNNIFVANSGSNDVTKITPSGVSSVFATTGSVPIEMTIDIEGTLYVSNLVSNSITKITSNGTSSILSTNVSSPFGIVVDQNKNVFVTNTGSNNITKISQNSAQFNYDELITSNNGATGQLIQTLDNNVFKSFIGDWASATSITGDTTGAIATITNINLQSYSIGGKTIFGGYSWTNINGNIGSSIDVLNLDPTEWNKDVYDDVNYYNKTLDLIEYDVENDWISRRYEVKSGNDVVYTFIDNNIMSFTNSAISVFQFGNEYDDNLQLGIGNNLVYHAYNENINFTGIYQQKLKFEINSSQYNNTFGQYTYQENLIFGQNSRQYNNTFGLNTYQYNITLGQSSNQNYIRFGQDSYQYNITLGQGSNQGYITFGQGSYQQDITLGQSSNQNHLTFGINTYQENIQLNSNSYQENVIFGQNASQSNLTFGQSSNQNYITLGNSSSQSDLIFNQNSSQQNIIIPASTSMQNIVFEQSVDVDSVDFSSATLVYENYPKTIYKRPDGTNKLRYYNNSDVLVISDITN